MPGVGFGFCFASLGEGRVVEVAERAGVTLIVSFILCPCSLYALRRVGTVRSTSNHYSYTLAAWRRWCYRVVCGSGEVRRAARGGVVGEVEELVWRGRNWRRKGWVSL